MTKVAFDEASWKDRLRAKNLRVTRSRLDVLRAMASSATPVPAQDIIDALADAGADRVTVYRTLNSLVEAGLAHKVDPGDRVWRYGLLVSEQEAAAGGGHNHQQHAHFVCDACGVVRCLEEATIRVSLKGKADAERFKVKQRDIYLHGTCEACQEDEAAAG